MLLTKVPDNEQDHYFPQIIIQWKLWSNWEQGFCRVWATPAYCFCRGMATLRIDCTSHSSLPHISVRARGDNCTALGFRRLWLHIGPRSSKLKKWCKGCVLCTSTHKIHVVLCESNIQSWETYAENPTDKMPVGEGPIWGCSYESLVCCLMLIFVCTSSVVASPYPETWYRHSLLIPSDLQASCISQATQQVTQRWLLLTALMFHSRLTRQ